MNTIYRGKNEKNEWVYGSKIRMYHKMDIERKILFQALVGSHNYNLNDESSDIDYKVFTLPTFDDLYYGEQYSKSKVGAMTDYDVHDVRKLTNLLWKSNINFIEVLFTSDFKVNHSELNKSTVSLVYELVGMRDSIAKMNLPHLYDACRGMYYNKMKSIHKGTSGTQYLVDKFGWDTKQGLHAYRVLDFLTRFADNQFTSFNQAMYYNETDKQLLMNIKHGKMSFEDFEKLAETKMDTVLTKYQPLYRVEQDKEQQKVVEEIVRQIVLTELNPVGVRD